MTGTRLTLSRGYRDAIPARLGTEDAWEERGGALWLTPKALDVRGMAREMAASGARFLTITAQEEDGGIRLDYCWDLAGRLLAVTTRAQDSQIASIYDLCEAADWIEREIHEYFAVEFGGRQTEPLFLRPGTPPGLNLRGEEDE